MIKNVNLFSLCKLNWIFFEYVILFWNQGEHFWCLENCKKNSNLALSTAFVEKSLFLVLFDIWNMTNTYNNILMLFYVRAKKVTCFTTTKKKKITIYKNTSVTMVYTVYTKPRILLVLLLLLLLYTTLRTQRTHSSVGKLNILNGRQRGKLSRGNAHKSLRRMRYERGYRRRKWEVYTA